MRLVRDWSNPAEWFIRERVDQYAILHACKSIRVRLFHNVEQDYVYMCDYVYAYTCAIIPISEHVCFDHIATCACTYINWPSISPDVYIISMYIKIRINTFNLTDVIFCSDRSSAVSDARRKASWTIMALGCIGLQYFACISPLGSSLAITNMESFASCSFALTCVRGDGRSFC